MAPVPVLISANLQSQCPYRARSAADAASIQHSACTQPGLATARELGKK
jgi:hypothetical protein